MSGADGSGVRPADEEPGRGTQIPRIRTDSVPGQGRETCLPRYHPDWRLAPPAPSRASRRKRALDAPTRAAGNGATPIRRTCRCPGRRSSADSGQSRSSGWLRGQIRSVPHRVPTVPGSLLLGFASTTPRHSLMPCSIGRDYRRGSLPGTTASRAGCSAPWSACGTWGDTSWRMHNKITVWRVLRPG
jgi:hypothetical protein